MIITHEWTGAPGASPTIKRVNGEVAACNHAIQIADYWNYRGVGGAIENVQINGDLWGGYTGRAVKVTPRDTTGAYDADSWRSPALEGQYVAFSILLASSMGDEYNNFQLGWVGPDLAYRHLFGVVVTEGGIRHTGVAVVPAGVTEVHLRSTFRGAGNKDRKHWFAEPILAVSDTEAKAVDQVATHFDGDTPDYSTKPPLLYHNGEWQEYVPKLYI